MLGLTKTSKPKTLLLGHVCLRIGEMVAIYYKKEFLRPRPSVICPALQPPMGPPGHPAFPSGHSLQGWLLSHWLMEITPRVRGTPIYKEQLEWLADRVAVNRERAGIHYPSDTSGGKHLAQVVFDAMRAMENGGQAKILYEIAGAAREEWKKDSSRSA
jgi:membrane-associated phospholipid phosphatase